MTPAQFKAAVEAGVERTRALRAACDAELKRLYAECDAVLRQCEAETLAELAALSRMEREVVDQVLEGMR